MKIPAFKGACPQKNGDCYAFPDHPLVPRLSAIRKCVTVTTFPTTTLTTDQAVFSPRDGAFARDGKTALADCHHFSKNNARPRPHSNFHPMTSRQAAGNVASLQRDARPQGPPGGISNPRPRDPANDHHPPPIYTTKTMAYTYHLTIDSPIKPIHKSHKSRFGPP
jgi:hypothetical protein